MTDLFWKSELHNRMLLASLSGWFDSLVWCTNIVQNGDLKLAITNWYGKKSNLIKASDISWLFMCNSQIKLGFRSLILFLLAEY